MKYENQILSDLQILASRLGHRLFRNNVAKLWAGKPEFFKRIQTVTVRPGDVLIRRARRFHAGLAKGSSDQIGWTQIEITPAMVGKKIPVFTGVEVKARGTRTRKEQKIWQDSIQSANGIALIIRDSAEYEEGIEEWKESIQKENP